MQFNFRRNRSALRLTSLVPVVWKKVRVADTIGLVAVVGHGVDVGQELGVGEAIIVTASAATPCATAAHAIIVADVQAVVVAVRWAAWLEALLRATVAHAIAAAHVAIATSEAIASRLAAHHVALRAMGELDVALFAADHLLGLGNGVLSALLSLEDNEAIVAATIALTIERALNALDLKQS